MIRVGWCSWQAAEHACRHWHYSGIMPGGKVVSLGVWSAGRFQGAIVYGLGANRSMAQEFKMRMEQVTELTRVALRRDHPFQVSRAMAVSLRMLRHSAPGLRLVVSYADSAHGHHGGIYQATNWIYLGAREGTSILLKGERRHKRSVTSEYGCCSVAWLKAHVDPKARYLDDPPKHKYIMPMNATDRRALAPLAQPYPKRSP